MRLNTSTCRKNPSQRSAFTLIEMLVAVALISILMLMFAQIFSLASDILGQQRGIAANDQTERQLRTVFRDDLNHRTFTDVKPFATPESGGETNREGYFHISEGLIADDTDDILQLTVTKGADEDPYYGRAVTIAGSTWGTDLNQPEFDDEIASIQNNVGASPFAEIAYFLRNGNLYRRVVLNRKPNISNNPDPSAGIDGSGADLITSPYSGAPYNGNFWSDFDYSAFYYDPTSTAAPNFIGSDARINDEPSSITTTITIGALSNIPVSQGIPRFRWGFDVATGQPRFKVSDGTNQFFIGRFTQQETSDPDFVYPGGNPATNWLDPNTNVSAYDTTNGVITDLNAGIRITEDILLKNVHSFDIKVWDPAVSLGVDGQPGVAGVDDNGDGNPDYSDPPTNSILDTAELGWPGSDDGDWRDVGHSDANGFYRSGANQNNSFGAFPVGGTDGNCYDTWHPTDDANFMPGSGLAPYRPVLTHAVNGILPQPLTMIRIHIRYVDQKSDQMRDVIIVHSLTK